MNSMKRLAPRIVFVAAVLLLAVAPTSANPDARDTRPPDIMSEPPVDQIIVKYKASADTDGLNAPDGIDRLAALSAAAGVELEYFRPMSGDAHVLRLPAKLPVAEVAAIAQKIAALPDVEYAEPDRILRVMLAPNDPRYGEQWHYSETYGINAPAAWDITTGSSSIVVAVIDTGYLDHGDLSGRFVPGYDFITNSTTANDGGGRDSDAHDPGDWTSGECGPASSSSWHGTHVAGTIGANSNNSLGVAGINWSSKILPVRVLGKCGGTLSDIADGIRWSAGVSVGGVPNNANPAKVINMSLGGSGSCSATEQNAIDDAVNAGTTVIVAAGNDNLNASGFTPASCNNVITVAATNRTGQRSYYSNYGSVVEISGPGGETTVTSNGILSTLNTGTQGPVADTYTFYQGTSMATPHVVGVASLLYSLSPSLSPTQVRDILQDTVTPFPGGSTCNTSICGTGIVNAYAAVNVLPRISNTSPVTAAVGGPTFTLTVNGANFVNGAVVRWNGSDRTTRFVNGTQLTATINAADIASSSIATVTVRMTDPTYGSITTIARTFSVQGAMNEFVYLPLIAKRWPPTPDAPVLNAIDNSDGDGNYSVTWNSAYLADTYTLQEDDNSSFSSPTTVYGPNTGLSHTVSGKATGTYYYRVKATNGYGDSGWSSTQSATVVPPASGPTPGFWQSSGGATEFYVSTDRANVNRFAIYVSVSGCGNYKITRITSAPISNNQFSFSGSYYASGTFSSQTSASGSAGLSYYYIYGCGYVSGGPWSWSATWKNSSQPSIVIGTVIGSDSVERMPTLTVTPYPATLMDK